MSSEQEAHQLAKEVNRGRRRQLFRWSASAGVLMVAALVATLIVISAQLRAYSGDVSNLRGRLQEVESSLVAVEERAAGFNDVLDGIEATLDGFVAEFRKSIRRIN